MLSKETTRHLRSENAEISFHTEHINPQLEDNTKRQESYHTQLRDVSKKQLLLLANHNAEKIHATSAKRG